MYSKGISWIDDCRIPFTDGGWGTRHNKEYPEWKGAKNFTHPEQILSQNTRGRFPANILVSDDMLNDGVYHKTGIASIPKGKKVYGRNSLLESKTEDYGGKFGALNEKGGSNSRYYDIDKWFEKLLDV
jgi:hypothetical protein